MDKVVLSLHTTTYFDFFQSFQSEWKWKGTLQSMFRRIVIALQLILHSLKTDPSTHASAIEICIYLQTA